MRFASIVLLAAGLAVSALVAADTGLDDVVVTAASPARVTAPSSAVGKAGNTRRAVHARDVYAADLPGEFSRAVRGVRPRVYVPNSESGTVTEVDPRTFRIIRTFPVGAYDQHITPSWDMRWLYVNNTASNTLTQLDPRTGRPVRTIRVPDPYNLYFTPDGAKAIVVAEALQRLDFRDPHTWRLIKSVPIRAPGPDHLDFTADGRALLISCEYAGVVYRVNTLTMRVTGRVHVGGLPVDVKLSADGSRFYVANQGSGGVTMISSRTLRILGFLHTGRGAHGFAVSRTTRDLYVANRIAGTISVISFARHRVVATWHVGGSPDMLQVSPNGRRLWTSNRYDSSISVISTRSGHVIRRIGVGSSPHGLAYFPQPGRYSLGHNGVYR